MIGSSRADDADLRVRPASLHRALLARGGRSAAEAAPREPSRWTAWADLPLPDEARLPSVLDGVLEVDWGAGPHVGAEAAPYFAEGWTPPPAEGVLAERSQAALRAAPWLSTDDPAEFARWLYAFGRAPAAVDDVRSGRARRGVLRPFDRWRLEDLFSPARDGAWEVFQLRSEGRNPSPPRHKVYVSPDARSLDDAMHVVATSILDAPPPAFKVARDRAASARPDKCIVYFHTRDAAQGWATRLAARLDGASSQGVPFTCAWRTDDGLLSWAVDPPSVSGARPESWRSWCTDRLGWSLAVARAADAARSTMPASDFALYRLSLDGVDVGRWRALA